MYSEELLAGRGVGCVATRDIEEGELIVSEEPALMLGPREKKRGVSSTTWENMDCGKSDDAQVKVCSMSGSVCNMSGKSKCNVGKRMLHVRKN